MVRRSRATGEEIEVLDTGMTLYAALVWGACGLSDAETYVVAEDEEPAVAPEPIKVPKPRASRKKAKPEPAAAPETGGLF